MKQIKYIILFATIISAPACKKFLNEQPLTQVEDKNYFKTLSDVNAAMAGIYGAFQGVMTSTGANFSGNYHYWGEARSDNFDKGQYGTATDLEIVTNQITAGNSRSDWSGLYKVIGRANTAIKFIPQAQQYDSRVNNTVRDNSLAQCYAIRAISYFYIVRLWGDAVVWTEPYDDYTVQAQRPRSSKDSVLNNVILADLTTAYNLVQKNQTPIVWNIGEGAIAAAMADVYMWKKDYANAITWIQKVFAAKGPKGALQAGTSGANLEPTATWKSLFINPAGTNEAIWSLNWDYTVNSCACLAISAGTSNNPLRVDSLLHTDWKKNTADIRPKLSYDTTNSLGHFDKVIKYYDVPGNVVVNSGTNALLNNVYLVMYRLGDVYLSYAEALNKTGDKTNSLKYLNFIRVRAGLPALAAADASIATPAMMEDVILKERQYELFAEGKRWFDLVRTDHVKTIMDAVTIRRQVFNGLQPTGWGGDTNKYLWPINRNRLEENKSITQNASYN